MMVRSWDSFILVWLAMLLTSFDFQSVILFFRVLKDLVGEKERVIIRRRQVDILCVVTKMTMGCFLDIAKHCSCWFRLGGGLGLKGGTKLVQRVVRFQNPVQLVMKLEYFTH